MVQKQQQPQKQVSSAQPHQAIRGPEQRVHPLHRLQHTIGNQAVQRMMQAHTATRRIQTKLMVNQPGDTYEQEADHIADQVMRMPDPQLQRTCACGGTCSKCQSEQPEHLQMKHVQASDTGQTSAPPSVDDVLHAAGQSLDAATRAFMETRFGHDFSGVRIHSDAAAGQSARDVNAHAYTVGHNVVFAAGQFAPGTHEGRRLLAHELTHVVQQKGTQSSVEGSKIQRQTPPVTETTPPDAGTPPVTEATLPTNEAAPSDAGTPLIDATSPTNEAVPPDAGTPLIDGGSTTNVAPITTSATPPPAETKPLFTPGGHTPASAGMAACPDAPPRQIVIIGCMLQPATTLPATETAILPALEPGRFGGDEERARFAKKLAQCRAEREVKEEIEKRFRSDVAAASESATKKARMETEAAIQAATEGIDPKNMQAIKKAKVQAAAEAKKGAARAIADAKSAVRRQDVAAVTADLATKYEDALAADYDATMQGALHRYRKSLLNTMKANLNNERKRITTEKSAKPKVPKGTTPPPTKSAAEIAAEVEAEMVEVRCNQQQWARNELEGYKHAWAVSRREEVDFLTIEKAPYLKDFKPTYEVATADLVQIPANLQGDKNMPGVAPELADFLTQLAADPDTPPFTAENYAHHGFGPWEGKGFSTDLRLTSPHDARGFWHHSAAVRFLTSLDTTAKKLGARWRVLYNDFGVAHEINQATGIRNIGFIGAPFKGDINWHGPDPLILHFHLDLEIPQKQPAAESQP